LSLLLAYSGVGLINFCKSLNEYIVKQTHVFQNFKTKKSKTLEKLLKKKTSKF